LQAEARKVLKAVSSWMRVKSEKASMDEIKATFLPFGCKTDFRLCLTAASRCSAGR
jgi:hypothetical protein